MTPRLTSALLTASVHGLVLVLLLAAWRVPQTGEEGAAAGQRLTTISLTDARDEDSEAKSRSQSAPSKAASPAEAAAADGPAVLPPPVRPIVPEVTRPVAIAPGEGPQEGERAGLAVVRPTSAPAVQVSTHAPAQAQASASDGGRPGAAPAVSDASAPARGSAGSNAYAVKVFRHILRRKAFPASLAQAGIRGRVLVRFNLTGSGEITDIAVARSSGVAALDGLALAQIRDAVPYPRPPKELSAAQLHFIVPMTYRPLS